MQLTEYFSENNGTVTFTEQQASTFAKSVAGDFNPIHDQGSRRFCVPGDLLFCVLLHRYGVADTSGVQFVGMLDGQTAMHLPDSVQGRTSISDSRERELLGLYLDGRRHEHPAFVQALSEQYVRFSGQTFPDILVPLMQQAQVMINPDRPMVIYKDMTIELDAEADPVNSEHVSLEPGEHKISVNGRKAAVQLVFEISADGSPIGRGEKNMVLSGLKPYEHDVMQAVIAQYNQWREDYARS